MLKNNKVNMALALVMAIVLWAYVLASDNQASTNTLRNIPITFANMETLTENNLVVLETERYGQHHVFGAADCAEQGESREFQGDCRS